MVCAGARAVRLAVTCRSMAAESAPGESPGTSQKNGLERPCQTGHQSPPDKRKDAAAIGPFPELERPAACRMPSGRHRRIDAIDRPLGEERIFVF